MFDIAWTELLIVAVVAILVVGPRELPKMLRGLGKFMGQMRRMAGDFQRQFNEALREAELDEIKRGFDSVKAANPARHIRDQLNPLKDTGDELKKAIEDPGAPKGSTGESGRDTTGGDAPAPPAKAAGRAAKSRGTSKSTAKPASTSASKSEAASARTSAARSGGAAKTGTSGKPHGQAAKGGGATRGTKATGATNATKTTKATKSASGGAGGRSGGGRKTAAKPKSGATPTSGDS